VLSDSATEPSTSRRCRRWLPIIGSGRGGDTRAHQDGNRGLEKRHRDPGFVWSGESGWPESRGETRGERGRTWGLIMGSHCGVTIRGRDWSEVVAKRVKRKAGGDEASAAKNTKLCGYFPSRIDGMRGGIFQRRITEEMNCATGVDGPGTHGVIARTR